MGVELLAGVGSGAPVLCESHAGGGSVVLGCAWVEGWFGSCISVVLVLTGPDPGAGSCAVVVVGGCLFGAVEVLWCGAAGSEKALSCMGVSSSAVLA